MNITILSLAREKCERVSISEEKFIIFYRPRARNANIYCISLCVKLGGSVCDGLKSPSWAFPRTNEQYLSVLSSVL